MHLQFSTPLTPGDHHAALTALLQRQDVRVGVCQLKPEVVEELPGSAMIWGIDAHGEDSLASESLTIKGVKQALAWAEVHNAPEHTVPVGFVSSQRF